MIALRSLAVLVPYLRRRRGLFFGVVCVVTVGMLAVIASVVVAGLAAWAEQWFAHVLTYRVIDARASTRRSPRR